MRILMIAVISMLSSAYSIEKGTIEREEMPDFSKVKLSEFDTYTPDKQDWIRLYVYDKFSERCEDFIQSSIDKKQIDNKKLEVLYKVANSCMAVKLNPGKIFHDEMTISTDKECIRLCVRSIDNKIHPTQMGNIYKNLKRLCKNKK